MALLSFVPSPVKGALASVTLDKVALFNLVPMGSYFKTEANVSKCKIQYLSSEGLQKKNLIFDLSQPVPSTTISFSVKARDLFNISAIILFDFDGGYYIVPSTSIPGGLSIDLAGAPVVPSLSVNLNPETPVVGSPFTVYGMATNIPEGATIDVSVLEGAILIYSGTASNLAGSYSLQITGISLVEMNQYTVYVRYQTATNNISFTAQGGGAAYVQSLSGPNLTNYPGYYVMGVVGRLNNVDYYTANDTLICQVFSVDNGNTQPYLSPLSMSFAASAKVVASKDPMNTFFLAYSLNDGIAYFSFSGQPWSQITLPTPPEGGSYLWMGLENSQPVLVVKEASGNAVILKYQSWDQQWVSVGYLNSFVPGFQPLGMSVFYTIDSETLAHYLRDSGNQSLYKSTNGGANWSRETDLNFPSTTLIAMNGNLYYATNSYFYKYALGGDLQLGNIQSYPQELVRNWDASNSALIMAVEGMIPPETVFKIVPVIEPA